MINVTDLTILATAADLAVAGVSILPPDREAEPGWVVATRTDGVRVRIDGVGEESPAVAAVLAADLSAGAVAARVLGRTRAEALPTLATRADTIGVQVRIVTDAIQTSTNDRLAFLFQKVAEALGTTTEALEGEFGRPARVLAPELFAYIANNPTAGDPAMPA